MTRCQFAAALAVACFACLPGLSARLLAEEPAPKVILDMDTIKHEAPKLGKDKTPGGTVELVDGKFGKACKFTFIEGAQGGFFTAWVNATADWDKAAGFSFWVKGDGSASWGGIELIDGENYGFRYGYCFPIDSTEWKKITVPWADLIPELPPADFVNAKAGYAPSKFRNFWFGKWFYWHDYPAQSFTIDQVALEPEIPVDTKDYTPATGGVPKLLAKLKAKEPVTIITMGDSLSDKRHWANKEVLWSEVLVADLKKTFGGDAKLVNPAIGGTLLQQNLILMPRWLKDTPAPDLVTVCFGFNDWDGQMRGEKYKAMLRVAVDRIRRMTGGKSEVLLMTTCPPWWSRNPKAARPRIDGFVWKNWPRPPASSPRRRRPVLRTSRPPSIRPARNQPHANSSTATTTRTWAKTATRTTFPKP